MESSSQEAVYLDFLIRDSLQKIADDLKTEFPIPIIEQYQLINNFILNLLSSDEIFHNLTYVKLEEKFYTTIIETPNKEVFANLEKKSILHLVEDSLSPIPEKSKIYEQLVSMFLIAKEKEHVLKMYFNKYLLDSDYISFVCVCAGYDLIKYLVFLESDKVTKIISEPLSIQQGTAVQKTNNNFDQFIDEVFNLEISYFDAYLIPGGYIKVNNYIPEKFGMPHTHKRSKFLDLSDYNQKESDYEFKIKKLQQAAITYLITLSPQQINLQIERLNDWEERFSRFWKWFNLVSKDFREGKLRFIDLKLKLGSFFNVSKYDEAIITQEFFDGLHDAAMFKNSYLSGFISQVKALIDKTSNKSLPILKRTNNNTVSKPVEVKPNIKNRAIKVKEYIPLYGDLRGPDFKVDPDIIYEEDGALISINELLANPEATMSASIRFNLDFINQLTFQSKLGECKTEEQIIEFLRDTLDDYRISNGDPLHWIALTLFDIEENFERYPAKYRGLIQKHLMDWLEFYEKAKKWNTDIELPNNKDSDAGNKEETPSIPISLKEYFNESAKEYIANYETRLKQFVSKLEATEIDFIERESEFWENCIYDLQNSEASHDGFSHIGIHTYEILYKLVMEIGYDKFHYSTLRKLEFLADRKKSYTLQLDKTLKQPDIKKNLNIKDHDSPKILQDIFINPDDMVPCIAVLKQLKHPVIDASNNYIGKAKGIFPLWIKILQRHPKKIINNFTDIIYKDLLNKEFPGLYLTADASEFRKNYKRLEKNYLETEIIDLLSQISQISHD